MAACLFVLEHRFAYSEPLRLALLSLTHGRPELLSPAAATPVTVLPEREARRAATALPKLQQAVAAGKTVSFVYYSIGRDEELLRTVDPYGLLLVGDEWYLIAWCHLRRAVRTFRLSRLRSRVTFATRAPHDFSPSADFALDDYLDRPAWQLGEPVGTATVRVAADMAWWVEAHFSRCGAITPAARPPTPGDSCSPLRTTRDSSSWPGCCPWARRPSCSSRPSCASASAPSCASSPTASMPRRSTPQRPSSCSPATTLPARREPRPSESRPARPRRASAVAARARAAQRRLPVGEPLGDPDWQVEADRFTRLATLMTYLHGVCQASGGAEETPVPVSRVCAALDTRRAQLKADIRLLNLVNFGGEGTLVWAEIKGPSLIVTCDVASSAFARPARLSPLQIDTLLLAVEILGGQLPTAHGAALHSAAQKLRGARRAAPPAVAAGERLATAEPILDAVNAAIGQHRLLDIEYWSEGSGTTSSRTVEPYLLVRTRGEWYYVAWCRSSQGTRTFRLATTKRATLRDERFAPRADVEVELYRREGVRSSERYAPRRAAVWYAAAVARWAAEREPTLPLPDGECLALLPYLDERWLIHEMLRFGGEALPLDPPAAATALRSVVARLLERYA